MALPFALFSWDGSAEYPLDLAHQRRRPYHAAWSQQPLDEAIDGTQIYGLYKSVVWDFTPYDANASNPGIPLAEYDLLKSLRTAGGRIRFRTWRESDRAMVVCTGTIDQLIAATIDERRDRAFGVRVEFTRVLEV